MNDDFLTRSEERNQIRAALGFPPLSPDGMEVLGEYADYALADLGIEIPCTCPECQSGLRRTQEKEAA